MPGQKSSEKNFKLRNSEDFGRDGIFWCWLVWCGVDTELEIREALARCHNIEFWLPRPGADSSKHL